MIRVVIDTNVVVSAALKPEGVEAAIVAAALGGLLQWSVSNAILAEYEGVLRRAKFSISRRWLDHRLIEIRRTATVVAPRQVIKESADDPDNRFLECAETAHADFLITGNKRHFPDEWKATIILTPRAFIDLWQKQAQPEQP
jgi:putative PIN family toxin of toxin-antitoxin system